MITLALPLASLVLSNVGVPSVQAERPVPLPAKPEVTVVTAEHLEGVLHLKFKATHPLRLNAAGRLAGDVADVALLEAILADRDAQVVRLFNQSAEWLIDFVERAEQRSGLALNDLSLYHRIEVEPSGVAALCDVLNDLDAVELAWPAASFSDPVATCAPTSAGGSPNFAALQDYREPAPLGIDADYANTFSGGRGIGITIVDVETGWTWDHEDFDGKLDNTFVSGTPANYPWDHGTATMAEVIGASDQSGVLGIAYDAEGLLATHSPAGQAFNVAAAVADAVAAATPGDIVMLEVQCFGAAPGPFPCEFEAAIFATVQAATAAGIHVIAAAGNGSNDLDGPAYNGAFDLNQQDSGAILVGASAGASLSAAGFSNYGSRVTSSGWGEDVVTAGYGDLLSGPATAEYTDTFNGTSSATPIVVGAAAVLTAIQREAFGSLIDPIAMRTLLQSTGTATTGEIGPRPNLAAAIAELGIPRIAIESDTGAGGILSISHAGGAGDFFAMYFAPRLALTPLLIEPLGYWYLQPEKTVFLTSGLLDAAGDATSDLPIPLMSPFSGANIFFQSVQLFGSSGDGSFSNALLWTLP